MGSQGTLICYQSWDSFLDTCVSSCRWTPGTPVMPLTHTTLSLISFFPHGTISLDFWNKMGSVVLPILECQRIESFSRSLERKRHKIVWPTFTRIIIDLTSSNWVFKLKLGKNRPTFLKKKREKEKKNQWFCVPDIPVCKCIPGICTCGDLCGFFCHSLSSGRNSLVRYMVWYLGFLFPKSNLSCQLRVPHQAQKSPYSSPWEARGAGSTLGVFDVTNKHLVKWHHGKGERCSCSCPYWKCFLSLAQEYQISAFRHCWFVWLYKMSWGIENYSDFSTSLICNVLKIWLLCFDTNYPS